MVIKGRQGRRGASKETKGACQRGNDRCEWQSLFDDACALDSVKGKPSASRDPSPPRPRGAHVVVRDDDRGHDSRWAEAINESLSFARSYKQADPSHRGPYHNLAPVLSINQSRRNQGSQEGYQKRASTEEEHHVDSQPTRLLCFFVCSLFFSVSILVSIAAKTRKSPMRWGRTFGCCLRGSGAFDRFDQRYWKVIGVVR